MALINGNDLDNTLSGSLDNDVIHGLGGNDSLSGFGGNDQIFGEAGNDTLDGGFAGTHRLNGGAGNDTYIVHNQQRDVISELTTPDGGIDTVDTDLTNYKLPSVAPVENLLIHGLGDQRTGVSSGEGNQFNNVITAQSGALHHVSVFELKGHAGNDTIFGDVSVSNEIFGGNGNDTIVGGNKADRLSGVDASGDGGNLGILDHDIIDVGFQIGNRDTVVLGDERGAYYNSLLGFANVKNFQLFEDELELAGTSQDYKMVVSQFADSAKNAKWDFTIQKKGDTIAILENVLDASTSATTAQQTADIVLRSASYTPINTPTLIGTNSSNTLQGTNASGIIDGRGGNDNIWAKGGNDIALGGIGNDGIHGGSGDDIIDGGAGRNRVTGDQGHDTFVLGHGKGVQLIEDFRVGEDRLGFNGKVALADIHFTKQGSRTIVRSASEDLAVLQGVQPNQLSLNDVVQVGLWHRGSTTLPTILG